MNGFNFGLLGIPSAAVWTAARKALEEIAAQHPNALQDHQSEVRKIFCKAVENWKGEVAKARQAANQKFMDDLKKAADQQCWEEKMG